MAAELLLGCLSTARSTSLLERAAIETIHDVRVRALETHCRFVPLMPDVSRRDLARLDHADDRCTRCLGALLLSRAG